MGPAWATIAWRSSWPKAATAKMSGQLSLFELDYSCEAACVGGLVLEANRTRLSRQQGLSTVATAHRHGICYSERHCAPNVSSITNSRLCRQQGLSTVTTSKK